MKFMFWGHYDVIEEFKRIALEQDGMTQRKFKRILNGFYYSFGILLVSTICALLIELFEWVFN